MFLNPKLLSFCKVQFMAENNRKLFPLLLIYIAVKRTFEKQKNASNQIEAFFKNLSMAIRHYIIPGIPPPIPPGIAGASSLISTKAHSVVKIIPATEAAFSKAIRVTFLGSIIPAFNIST